MADMSGDINIKILAELSKSGNFDSTMKEIDNMIDGLEKPIDIKVNTKPAEANVKRINKTLLNVHKNINKTIAKGGSIKDILKERDMFSAAKKELDTIPTNTAGYKEARIELEAIDSLIENIQLSGKNSVKSSLIDSDQTIKELESIQNKSKKVAEDVNAAYNAKGKPKFIDKENYKPAADVDESQNLLKRQRELRAKVSRADSDYKQTAEYFKDLEELGETTLRLKNTQVKINSDKKYRQQFEKSKALDGKYANAYTEMVKANAKPNFNQIYGIFENEDFSGLDKLQIARQSEIVSSQQESAAHKENAAAINEEAAAEENLAKAKNKTKKDSAKKPKTNKADKSKDDSLLKFANGEALNEKELLAVSKHNAALKRMKGEDYNEAWATQRALGLIYDLKTGNIEPHMDTFGSGNNASNAVLKTMTGMPTNNQKNRDEALRSLNPQKYQSIIEAQNEAARRALEAEKNAPSEFDQKYAQIAERMIGGDVFANESKKFKGQFVKMLEKYGDPGDMIDDINKEWLKGELDGKAFKSKTLQKYLDSLNLINDDDLIAKKKEYYGIKSPEEKAVIQKEEDAFALKNKDLLKSFYSGNADDSLREKAANAYLNAMSDVSNGMLDAEAATQKFRSSLEELGVAEKEVANAPDSTDKQTENIKEQAAAHEEAAEAAKEQAAAEEKLNSATKGADKKSDFKNFYTKEDYEKNVMSKIKKNSRKNELMEANHKVSSLKNKLSTNEFEIQEAQDLIDDPAAYIEDVMDQYRDQGKRFTKASYRSHVKKAAKIGEAKLPQLKAEREQILADIDIAERELRDLSLKQDQKLEKAYNRFVNRHAGNYELKGGKNILRNNNVKKLSRIPENIENVVSSEQDIIPDEDISSRKKLKSSQVGIWDKGKKVLGGVKNEAANTANIEKEIAANKKAEAAIESKAQKQKEANNAAQQGGTEAASNAEKEALANKEAADAIKEKAQHQKDYNDAVADESKVGDKPKVDSDKPKEKKAGAKKGNSWLDSKNKQFIDIQAKLQDTFSRVQELGVGDDSKVSAGLDKAKAKLEEYVAEYQQLSSLDNITDEEKVAFETLANGVKRATRELNDYISAADKANQKRIKNENAGGDGGGGGNPPKPPKPPKTPSPPSPPDPPGDENLPKNIINAQANLEIAKKRAEMLKANRGSNIDLGLEKAEAKLKEYIAEHKKLSTLDNITDEQALAFATLGKEVGRATSEVSRYITTAEKIRDGVNTNFVREITNSDLDKIRQGDSDVRRQVLNDYVGYLGKSVREVRDFTKANTELSYVLKNVDGSYSHMTASIDMNSGKIATKMVDASKYKTAVGKVFEGIKAETKKYSKYLISSFGIQEIIQAFRKGIQSITEIDTALTELKKVTNETDATYDRFLQNASKTASVIGSSVAEITNMAAAWARLGYSINEAADLAKSTAILLNVSEFTDANTASEALISTMQAFKYEAKDSAHVVDILNEVGNNYAVSSDGLAVALQDSASVLMEGGNNLEQSVALIASANKVLQDPNVVGGALRTISLRLRGTSTEVLEGLGEETDGAVEGVSKMQEKIKALTGVDIVDMNGAYKDTYTILKEIGAVWDDMTDMDKAAVLELMAGKNRSNALAAILGNMKDLEGAYESAMNAEGSAMRENAAYLDSIQGKMDLFKNAAQTFWMNFISSDAIKNVVSAGTMLLNFLDTGVGKFAAITAAVMAFLGVSQKLTLAMQIDAFLGLIKGLWDFSTSLVAVTTGQRALTAEVLKDTIVRAANNGQLALAIVQEAGLASVTGVLTAEQKANTTAALINAYANEKLSASSLLAATSTMGLKSAMQALKAVMVANPAVMVAGIAAAAAAIGVFVDVVHDTTREATDKADEKFQTMKETADATKNEISSLNDEISKLDEQISNLEGKKLSFTESQELARLKDQRNELEHSKKVQEQILKLQKKSESRAAIDAMHAYVKASSAGAEETEKKWKTAGTTIGATAAAITALGVILAPETGGLSLGMSAAIVGGSGAAGGIAGNKLGEEAGSAVASNKGSYEDWYDTYNKARESAKNDEQQKQRVYKHDTNNMKALDEWRESQTKLGDIENEMYSRISQMQSYYNELEYGMSDEVDKELDQWNMFLDKFSVQEGAKDAKVTALDRIFGKNADKNIKSLKKEIELAVKSGEEFNFEKAINGSKELKSELEYIGISAKDVEKYFTQLGDRGVDIVGYKSYTQLSEAVSEYNNILSQTNEVVTDNAQVTKEYKESLKQLGISEEDLNACFYEGNPLIVKNADALRELVAGQEDAIASNISFSKSMAEIGYAELVTELDDMLNTGLDANGQLTEFVKHQADVIIDEIDRIKLSIKQYEMLRDNLHTQKEFDNFNVGKSIDEQNTAGTTYTEMVNAAYDALHNTGKVGTQAFRTAVEAIVPDSVYKNQGKTELEQLKAINDYINNKIVPSMTLENNTLSLTQKNMDSFVDKMKEVGVLSKESSKDGKLSIADGMELDKALELMGMTKTQFLSMLQELKNYNFDESTSLISQLFGDNFDSEYSENVKKIEDLNRQKLQILENGGYKGKKNKDAINNLNEQIKTAKKNFDTLGKEAYKSFGEFTNFKTAQSAMDDLITKGMDLKTVLNDKNFGDLAKTLDLDGLGIEWKGKRFEEVYAQIEELKLKISEPTELQIKVAKEQVEKEIEQAENKIKGHRVGISKNSDNVKSDALSRGYIKYDEETEKYSTTKKSSGDKAISDYVNLLNLDKSLSGYISDGMTTTDAILNNIQGLVAAIAKKNGVSQKEIDKNSKNTQKGESVKPGSGGSGGSNGGDSGPGKEEDPKGEGGNGGGKKKNKQQLKSGIYDSGKKDDDTEAGKPVSDPKGEGRGSTIVPESNSNQTSDNKPMSEYRAESTTPEMKEAASSFATWFSNVWGLNNPKNKANGLSNITGSKPGAAGSYELAWSVPQQTGPTWGWGKGLSSLSEDSGRPEHPIKSFIEDSKGLFNTADAAVSDFMQPFMDKLYSADDYMSHGLFTDVSDFFKGANEEFNLKILAEGGEDVQWLLDAMSQLDDKTVKAIAEVLGQTNVEELQAAFGQLDDKTVKAIAEALTTGDFTNLKKMVDEMPPEEKKKIEAVAKAMGYESVDELFTSVENLSDKEIQAIAKALGITDIDSLRRAVNKVPDTRKTQLIAKLGDSLQNVNDLRDKLSKLPNTKSIIISVGASIAKTAQKVWNKLSGGGSWTGNAHAEGTAHVNGTAFAGGKWGAKKTETALMGELGPEMIVRGNRWFTVGEGGAGFEHVQKGDIIFNHKQTEEILRNGHINSRGKAMAGGTAHAQGTAYALWDVTTKVDSGGKTSYSFSGSSSTNSKKATKDASKDFKEFFDWFEVRLSYLNNQISQVGAKLANAVSTVKDLSNSSLKMKLAESVINLNVLKRDELEKGVKLYSGFAEKMLQNVPAAYRTMASDGAVKIEQFVGKVGDTTLDAIKQYREWRQKFEDAYVKLQEAEKEIAQAAKQKFDIIVQTYDTSIGMQDQKSQYVQGMANLDKEKGEPVSTEYYKKLMSMNQSKSDELAAERKRLKEELDYQVNKGWIKKDSEEWNAMVTQIYNVDKAIQDCTLTAEQYQNTINQIHWDNFKTLINNFDYINNQANSMIKLLGNIKDAINDPELNPAYDDIGWGADAVTWTDEGLAQIGLHVQNMEMAIATTKEYEKEVDALNQMYKAGKVSEIEYADKLNELQQGQFKATETYYSERDAIVAMQKARVDAIKNGINKEINAYNELIKKKKEELSEEKD